MKPLMLFFTFSAASIFAFAQVKDQVKDQLRNAEFFEINDWIGEYPDGYQIIKDIEVPAVKSPSSPSHAGYCTLKKNMVIHPWAHKTLSEFVSLQGVVRFQALKNFQIWNTDDQAINVRKGDEVIQLAYLSEGVCLMRVRGQVGTESCLESAMEDDRAKVTSYSPFKDQQYFKTKCLEGGEKWINADILKDYALESEDGDAYVKFAEMPNFGEVYEP